MIEKPARKWSAQEHAGHANHNGRKLEEIPAQFRTERLRLLDRLGELQPELFAKTKLHPRLKQPMRLVDHLHLSRSTMTVEGIEAPQLSTPVCIRL